MTSEEKKAFNLRAMLGMQAVEAGVVDTTNPKDLLGAKKVDLSVLPDVGSLHTAHAMMNGARKYSAYNWREKSVRADIYVAAARRHLMQWFDREETAQDSGVHHLGHAAACLFILMDAQANNCLVDNRPQKPGGVARVLANLNRAIEREAAK